MRRLQRLSISILCFCLVTQVLLAKNIGNNTYQPTNSDQLSFETPQFRLNLQTSSQTLALLKAVDDTTFSFVPTDRLASRAANGFYHLGDINFKAKKVSDTNWEVVSSATNRADVIPLPISNNTILAAADMSPTLPASSPIKVCRFWELQGDNLALRFELTNNSTDTVELGALGIPMVFNNILDGKSLDKAHHTNVFSEPYIGAEAGYIQVVRLKGDGPVLVVMPFGNTSFEGYRPLLDDPTPRSTTFEGFHEWMVCSKAYAESSWKNSEPWNSPTSLFLKPGETHTVGVLFSFASDVRDIEKTLIKNRRPVAVGIPGYVMPQDIDGSLFINYPEKVISINVEPKGAMSFSPAETTPNGWQRYSVEPIKWGRARVSIVYQDSLLQTINYKIVKPEADIVADNGNFLLNEQWFDQPNDMFGRSPSVITYDDEKKEQVLQDSRAWIAGLSDEGGAGSWLNAMMNLLINPSVLAADKLESFVTNTLWGGIQYNAGNKKYGVRKSLFYYQPDSMPQGVYRKDINFNTWAAWSKKAAEVTDRSYNYPHVAAAHWVMYRLARNYSGLVQQQTWQWYLRHAYHTAMAMVEQAPYYAQFGQMEGTIFLLILKDLKAEGFDEMATKLEIIMKARADHWALLNFPFGSEMAWDSTGQEEVYMWSQYFGFDDKAEVTIKAILAYMGTMPHWAYNGNARRYWDFLYGGKLSRIERMVHHYGSGLNAIPLLTQYRKTPSDFYMLRVGYGGLLGTLSNITTDGFAPCASHSFPSSLKNDGISGDYGSGFLGYAVNSATYIVKQPEFGWLAFGGNLTEHGNVVNTTITTAAKSRIFIAPLGLWLTLDAGTFKEIVYHHKTKKIHIVLDAKQEFMPSAYLRIEQTDNTKELHKFTIHNYKMDKRGGYHIPLSDCVTTFNILEK